MLKYVQTILEKVSFDLFLFEKELRKSITKFLKPNEVESLRNWCYQQFNNSDKHLQIVSKYFS